MPPALSVRRFLFLLPPFETIRAISFCTLANFTIFVFSADRRGRARPSAVIPFSDRTAFIRTFFDHRFRGFRGRRYSAALPESECAVCTGSDLLETRPTPDARRISRSQSYFSPPPRSSPLSRTRDFAHKSKDEESRHAPSPPPISLPHPRRSLRVYTSTFAAPVRPVTTLQSNFRFLPRKIRPGPLRTFCITLP